MNITTLKNKIKNGEFVAISTSSERIPEGIHKINKVQNKSFNIIAEGTTFWFDFPRASECVFTSDENGVLCVMIKDAFGVRFWWLYDERDLKRIAQVEELEKAELERIKREFEEDEKIEKVEKIEKDEKIEEIEKLEKVEDLEKVEEDEKIEEIEKIEKVEELEKVEKIEEVEEDEKIEDCISDDRYTQLENELRAELLKLTELAPTEASYITMEQLELTMKKLVQLRKLKGIHIYTIGRYIWVSGNTYPVKEELKELGFIYRGKKWNWTAGERVISYKKLDEEKLKSKYGALNII